MSHQLGAFALAAKAGPNYNYDIIVEVPRQGIWLAYNLLRSLDGALLLSARAYWPLDESSGTRFDQSAFGSNDLTDNFTVLSAPGPVGPAAKFVAPNTEFLDIADNAALSFGNENMAISAWVYLESKPAVQSWICGKWLDAGDLREYLLGYNTSTDQFGLLVSGDGTSGTQSVVFSTNLPSVEIGTWYLVNAWHDAGADTINMQVNNGQVSSVAHTAGIFDGTQAFRVGTEGAQLSTEYWNGRIANLGIWPSVLTAAQQVNLWNDGLGTSLGYHQRLRALSDIEYALRPGGGLGAINSATFEMVVDNVAPSPQATYDSTNPVVSSPAKIKLLFTGDQYANAVELLTGRVDAAPWVGMDAIFTLVDESLVEDHILPHAVVNQDTYPNAPDISINQRVPIIYGDSGGRDDAVVPALLVDNDARVWLLSAHANTYLEQTLLLWQDAQDGYTLLHSLAFASVNTDLNQVTLADELKGRIFGEARAKHIVQASTNAVNTANAIDGDATTDTELQTNNAAGLGSVTVRGTFPSEEDVTTSLEGHWPLNEASGTRIDVAGSNDLTDTGSVGRGPGIVNNAANFTGGTQKLAIADNAALSVAGDLDFTIAGWFWFRTLPTSGNAGIVSKWLESTNQKGYLLDYEATGSRIRFFVSPTGSGGTSVDADTINQPQIKRWYFFIVWHDATGNTINIQINNGAITSAVHTGGVFDNTAEFMIGNMDDGASGLDGMVEEVRFYKRLLSPPERTQLWNAGAGLSSGAVPFINPVNNLVKTAVTQEYQAGVSSSLENRSFVQSIDLSGATPSLFSNLIALWTMDEASGNRADLIGSRDLVENGTIGQATGKIDDAADFPGTAQWLSLADEAAIRGGQTLTYTFWVFVDTLALSGLFDKSIPTPQDPDQDYRLTLEDVAGTWRFVWYVSSTGLFFASILDGGHTVSTVTWYFVRVWIDTTGGTIGIQIDSRAAVSAIAGTHAGSGDLNIGRFDGGDYFDGRIDNPILHHRMLTDAEHTALYNDGAGFAHPFGETVRRTIFDTGQHLSIQNEIAELPIQTDETRLGIDVTALALFPGGNGAAADDVLVAEVEISAGFRPDGNNISLFMGRVQGRQDDSTGTVTGTANALIENQADVIRSIILNDMTGQFVETSLFNSARTALAGMNFFGGVGAGYPQTEIGVRELLDSLAVQARAYVFQIGDGDWAMQVYDASRASAYDFTQADFLWTPGGEPLRPADRLMTFRVLPVPVTSVFNRFQIRYGWHAGRQQYTRTQFANNISHSHSTEDLSALCATSVLQYREQPPYLFNASHIREDAAAEALLSHVVNYFTAHKFHVEFLTTFVAIHLIPGDIVTVTHPLLPAAISGEKFEVLRMRYNLQQGTVAIEAREV